jgi:hypothetical protein
MKKVVKNRKNRLVKTQMLATTLLVTVTLLLSSATALAAVNGSTQYLPNIQLAESSPFSTMQTAGGQNTGDPDADYILKYHSGYNNNAVGLTSPGVWQGAIRLTPTELGPYNGWNVTEVNWYFHESAAMDGNLFIYDGGTPTQPGAVLYNESFTVSGAGLKTFVLATPVLVDASADLWVSIECNQVTAPFYPIGIDAGPAVAGKGDMIYLTSWATLSGYGLNYNWVIEAKVEGALLPNDVGVTSIISPVSGTAEGPIVPKANVKNFGADNQTNVPVDMTITAYGEPTGIEADGFESFVPGEYMFPPGWTIQTTNPTGTWYMHTSSQTYSAATYPRVQEATSDGNAQDESLISPTIDCSDLSYVHVMFTKYFYVYPTGDVTSFTLYGSIDDGATWPYTIVTYSATSSVSENINITAWAAGESLVKFRFRFESAADTGLNSYLYFDNFWVGHNLIPAWGPYGDNPPIGWDIQNYPTNPTVWNNNYWHRYTSLYTSYDSMWYCARTYYMSPYEDVNCALITPSIDCSDLSDVYVYMNGYFYYYLDYSNGAIEISVNGSAWETVYEFTATRYHYEFPGYNNYDITSWAAGQSDVKVRFRYYHTAAQTGRYWYLSNVRVGDGSGNFIFYDSFNGQQAYSTNFKFYYPDDWVTWDWEQVTGSSTGNQFQNLESSTLPTATPYEGTRMACYNAYNALTGEQARLYSMPYDVSAAVTLKLKFAMFHGIDYPTVADSIQVQVSTDGTTWTNIGDPFYRSCSLQGLPLANAWHEHIVDLIGYEDETALQIAFLGTSAATTTSRRIYLDAVELFDPGLILEYSETVYVDVDSGETVEAVFPAWTPDAWQNITYEGETVTYDAFAATDLTGDQDPSNDFAVKTFDLSYPLFYDVEVVEIISPTSDGDAKPLPVKATIKNVGQFRVRNFFVTAAIGSSFARSVQEDFSGVTPPAIPDGWNVNNAKWSTVNTANAGGTAPEARFFYSPSETGQFRLYCDPFNTVGQTNIDLTFRHMVNHYTTPYTLRVETSTDGGATWNSVWSVSPTGSIPATQVTVPLTAAHGVGSPSFQISFTFDGYSWNINYWYVDNIVCGTLPPIVDAEYDESAAVASWLYPGETMELTYPEWTPANLIDPRDSGVIKYTINVESLYPGDGDPSNDIGSATFKLKYWHDVSVKSITQPSRGKDITWLHYDDGTNVDAIGLTAGGTFYYGIRLTPTELGSYDGYQLTTVKHHHGYSGSTAPSVSGTVYIRDAGTSTTPGAVLTEQTYTTGSAPGWEEYVLTDPVTVDGSKDLWVIFSVTHASGQYPAGVGPGPMIAGKGGWISLDGTSWDELAGYGLNYNWNMWAGVEEGGPGPGAIDIYIAPGTEQVQSIVKNAGVFIEAGLTASAKIYEFITDPVNGTLVYDDEVTGINLNPLGEEKTINFDSYTFVGEGVYLLMVELPLADDDVPANNVKKLGVGVDTTKPTSAHQLTPANPDGSNGWYVSDVKATITGSDPESNGVSSGVKEIRYRVDDGSWQTVTGTSATVTVTTNGEHTVEYYAVDNVGNIGTTNSVSFKIDQADPIMAMEYTAERVGLQWQIVVTVTARDDHSGMDKVEFYHNTILQETVEGEGPTYTWSYIHQPGLQVILRGVAYDKAGHSVYMEIENPVSVNVNQQQSQQLLPKVL